MFTVNGREYQHALINAQAAAGGSRQFRTFKSINYEDGAEKKPVTDSQGQIIGYTIDAQKTDASMSMLKSKWHDFQEWLLSQNPGVGLGQIVFDMPVSYGDTPLTLRTDTLLGVMIQK